MLDLTIGSMVKRPLIALFPEAYVNMENRSFFFTSRTSHAVNDIYWFILPAVLPLILEQFGLDYGPAGGLLTAFLGMIAFFSMVFGKLSDRYPRWLIIGLGFVLTAGGMVAAGLSPTFPIFFVLILITGVGVSTYHPTMYAAFDESTVDRRGKNYGSFEFWGATGIFIMFIAYGRLLQVLDWRGLFFISAIPAVIMAYVFLRIRGSSTSEKYTRTIANDKLQDSERTPLLVSILFFLGVTVRILCITAVVNFIPTYLVRDVGLPPWTASYGSGFIFLGGMLFVPLAGILADRWTPLPVLHVLAAATGPVIFLVGTLQTFWSIGLMLILFGGCWLGVMPSQNMMLSSLHKSVRKGQAFGILIGLMTVTNALGPGLFGVLADKIGLGASIQVFSLPAVLGWVFFLLMSRNAFMRTSELYS